VEELIIVLFTAHGWRLQLHSVTVSNKGSV